MGLLKMDMRKIICVCSAAVLGLSGCGSRIESDRGAAPATAGTAAAGAVSESAEGSGAQPQETAAETTTTTTTTTTTATTLVTTSAPVEEETSEYVNGCILANAGTPQVRAMEEYYYGYDAGEYLARSVDGYAAAVGEGTDVYLMVIPTSQEFYTPEDLKDGYADQLESTREVYSQLTAAKGVFINQKLEDHKAEYIYSRTDYHWQPLAAFYAAGIFAEEAGVPFAEFDTYEEIQREGYLGAFYTVNEIYALEEYPDTFTYYKPANLDNCVTTFHDTWFTGGSEGQLFNDDIDIGSSYTVFVGTDDTILEVDTDADNDRVLVIFKDSYGNALVPFLTSSFSKIYLCDNRFFNINSVSFAQEVGATDVLFALGAPSANSYDKVSLIEQNMSY